MATMSWRSGGDSRGTRRRDVSFPHLPATLTPLPAGDARPGMVARLIGHTTHGVNARPAASWMTRRHLHIFGPDRNEPPGWNDGAGAPFRR
jgi:hypothetical protein